MSIKWLHGKCLICRPGSLNVDGLHQSIAVRDNLYGELFRIIIIECKGLLLLIKEPRQESLSSSHESDSVRIVILSWSILVSYLKYSSKHNRLFFLSLWSSVGLFWLTFILLSIQLCRQCCWPSHVARTEAAASSVGYLRLSGLPIKVCSIVAEWKLSVGFSLCSAWSSCEDDSICEPCSVLHSPLLLASLSSLYLLFTSSLPRIPVRR